MPPNRHFQCLICGQEVNIPADEPRPGILTWPNVHCGNCYGNPKMAVNNGHTEEHPARAEMSE